MVTCKLDKATYDNELTHRTMWSNKSDGALCELLSYHRASTKTMCEIKPNRKRGHLTLTI